MSTVWKEHLDNVREKNPHLNLGECMKLASESYRGGNRKTQNVRRQNPISKRVPMKNEAKAILKKINEKTKELNKNSDELTKKDIQTLQKVLKYMDTIIESFQSSDSESESESDSSNSSNQS